MLPLPPEPIFGDKKSEYGERGGASNMRTRMKALASSQNATTRHSDEMSHKCICQKGAQKHAQNAKFNAL